MEITGKKRYTKLNEDFDTEVLHDVENSEADSHEGNGKQSRPFTKKVKQPKRYATDMYEGGDGDACCEAIMKRIMEAIRKKEIQEGNLKDMVRLQKARHKMSKLLNQYKSLKQEIFDTMNEYQDIPEIKQWVPMQDFQKGWQQWQAPRQYHSFGQNVARNLTRMAGNAIGKAYDKADSAASQAALYPFRKASEWGDAIQNNYDERVRNGELNGYMMNPKHPAASQMPFDDFEKSFYYDNDGNPISYDINDKEH